jgi:LEA14-like dessication related protein
MVKSKKPLLNGLLGIGGLLLAIRFFVGKTTAAKSLNVNVTGVDFNRSNMSFVVMVRLINPSNSPLQVKSIVADCLWNNIYGATISFLDSFTLKGGEERTIQVPVKANLEWYTIFLDVIKNPKNTVNGTFELKGVVNAEGLVVPLEYKKTFKIIS